MRKQMIENAAYEVATQVRAVEESIEAALAEMAELQARMIRARSVTGAGFVASHAAFEQLAAATSGLVAARGGIVNCHAALAETRKSRSRACAPSRFGDETNARRPAARRPARSSPSQRG